MVKFLKFVLFLVVVAFSFALGVKFSDSFKGTSTKVEKTEVKIEEEMKKAFDNNEGQINNNNDISNGTENTQDINTMDSNVETMDINGVPANSEQTMDGINEPMIDDGMQPNSTMDEQPIVLEPAPGVDQNPTVPTANDKQVVNPTQVPAPAVVDTKTTTTTTTTTVQPKSSVNKK